MSETKSKIIETLIDQISGLLEENYDKAHKDAVESFKNDEDAKEPIIKLGIVAKWNPESRKVKVETSISWSVKREDGSEKLIDMDQPDLPGVVEITINGKGISKKEL